MKDDEEKTHAAPTQAMLVAILVLRARRLLTLQRVLSQKRLPGRGGTRDSGVWRRSLDSEVAPGLGEGQGQEREKGVWRTLAKPPSE